MRPAHHHQRAAGLVPAQTQRRDKPGGSRLQPEAEEPKKTAASECAVVHCGGRHTACACYLLAILSLLAAGSAIAQDEPSADQRFLAGLRARGLYRLAEKYCTGELGKPDLSAPRRADLVAELSLVLAEQAVSSPPAARAPLWQRAWQVTEDFAREHPDHPRLIQVRLQGALGLLAHGELARQEAELSTDRQRLIEQARAQLREAIGQLRQVAEAVEQVLRRQDRAGPAAEGGLSARQLESIQSNVRYELARAYRNQGQCYAPGSEDRADALNQALALLDPLARLDTGHPLAWRSRIDQIACCLLLEDYPRTRQKLAALAAEKPPAEILLRARAERVRLALAENKLQEAMTLVSAGREIDGVTSPELDLAALQTYIACWRAAKQANRKDEADQWYTKAAGQVRLVERDHGPYWMRRAETLLAGSVGGSPEGGDLATLVRTAEGFFRSGRPDDAVATYDRARAVAAKEGNTDGAFQAGYVAATIEHQRGRHQEAMTRYGQLAQAMPNHPKAPEAHLLAIQHAGELAKTAEPAALEQYTALLEQHRRTWPRAPGTDRVRWLSARLCEFRRDWQGAIQAYREISAADPRYAEAVDAAGRCYEAWLSERKAAGKPTERPATEAAVWFESLITGTGNRLPERWSPAQQQAALIAARLWLNYTASGYARARQVLSAALAGAPEAPEEWKSAARALLVYSLAGAGRGREAAEVLAEISAGRPGQLLAMLEGLSQVAADAEPKVQAELAGLELQAIKLLEPRHDQLSEAQAQTLRRIHAQALADAGHADEALRAFRALAAEYPRDARIQEGHARLLLGQKDRASLETALDKWRQIERNCRQGTDRWYRAKHAVALVHYRLGNKQRAARIITQLEVLHPELGGREMAARFRELLAKCQK